MPLFVTSEPNKVKLMKRLQSLVFGAIEDVYVYHTNMIYPDIIVLKELDFFSPFFIKLIKIFLFNLTFELLCRN